MERHSKLQGTLHYQLADICDFIFDMREITEQDNFLYVLYELNKIFHPAVFWLCNNSPWLEGHLKQVREIFSDTAIIAQDVYDTKLGWIEYYKNPENKLFDRYIAITELIKKVFIKEYFIPEDKIDVIYSVVNGERIQKEIDINDEREVILREYGLNPSLRYFSTVGRLTEQKNPIRYLKLIQEFIKHNSENDISFVLVGDGNLAPEVDLYIHDNKLEKKVIRIPYISNTPRFIGALDGLIITSDYEGLPIVSIEAMSMGTPIFSTDSGDTRRFVEKNGCGLIIDGKKSDFDNFQSFLNHYDEYKNNAKKCSADMLKFFSVETISKLYEKSFAKAMEK